VGLKHSTLPWFLTPLCFSRSALFDVHFLDVLQIFNEINSRRVHNELNVFDGFFKNGLFVSIVLGTVGVQALLVEVGSKAFKVTGLTWQQWLICVVMSLGWSFCLIAKGIGSSSLLWQVVLHFLVPPSVIPNVCCFGRLLFEP
jgi:hypothetical protein